MKITKIHGCGNDFVFTKYEEGRDYSSLAKILCDRHIGIGGDGLIIVKEDPLEMIYYNADGSRAPMCGNGIRCFALYCYKYKVVDSLNFDVVTLAGIMKIKISKVDPFLVEVNMGKAFFDNKLLQINSNEPIIKKEITVCGQNVEFTSVFLGTVHTVIFVDDFNDSKLLIAKEIHEDKLFQAKTNVNFVKVINDHEIEVKTYERGCGWTLACGTGCCASVFIANMLNSCKKSVKVHLTYGELLIELRDDVYMTGPAKIVFETEWNEEE